MRLFFGLLFTLMVCTTGHATPNPLHIIVDPGHGGRDDGAVRKGRREADIALQVAKELARLLENNPNFKVTMTRTRDATVSLSERTDLAKSLKGDLFLSIHVNASSDPRAQGVEFYFQNQLPPDEDSLFLANKENAKGPISRSQVIHPADPSQFLSGDVKFIVQDLQKNYHIEASSEMAKSLASAWSGQNSRRSRRIRQAPFFVVSNVSMPSALVELGFISNKNEAKKLIRKNYQKKLATNLYLGLINFKELLDK